MSIRMDVKGLEEVERQLREMKEGLSTGTIKYWAERIQSDARDRAGNLAQEISIEVTEVGGGKFDIKVNSTRESLPYVTDAIQRMVTIMPITTKGIFQTLLERLRS